MKQLPSKLTRRMAHYATAAKQLWTQVQRSFAGSLYYVPSFAQEGEDILLLRMLEGRQRGFYVDIGAHHPKRFSNTYLFYQMGWRGINIDAMPGSMRLFRRQRPRDINIETVVGRENSVQKFYLFNEPALNTFDPHLAEERVSIGYHIIATTQIQTRRLADLLTDVMPANCHIDFMSIDVEGFDLDVLQSNDWQRFRADFVLIEQLESQLDAIMQSEVYMFMTEQQYRLCAKSLNTLVFHDVTERRVAANLTSPSY